MHGSQTRHQITMPSDGAELGKDDGIVDVLGRAEGTLLGAELMLGCKLGLPVGDKLRLGEPEGAPEGSRLGEWEGLREGNELGLEEGCMVIEKVRKILSDFYIKKQVIESTSSHFTYLSRKTWAVTRH